MSEESERIKLLFVRELMSDIDRIIERHGGLASSLDDFEGRHAILMCLLMTGETLNKIESSKLRRILPVDLTYTMRNIISYDYMGVNNRAVSGVVEHDVPALKREIEAILGED